MTASDPVVPLAVKPSVQPGMGTILYPGGVTFRVWAPFASSVFAAGTFNKWSDTGNPFASEGNGYWSVDVPGAKIGDEYQFVIRNGNQPPLWHKNPYASEVVNSSGNAIIHDPVFDWTGEDFVVPPRNGLVIYEMHVGSFNDSAGEGPGTFDEIVPKLPYLHDLGINAIEIMPVLEFPMSFSWGYNPSDPFAVESALGGPQGLQRFVKAAHALGIAVIMDVVYNHFGPGDLDLWRFDGWSDWNHNGGIYFYDNDRSHTDWGDTRPDYGRPEVRQYLRDNALFWLNKYHLDGLRFDSVSNIRSVNGRDLPDGWSLLQWIHDEIRSTQPWKITIAEDLQNNEWITKETGAGGAGFSSQWDAAFVHPIRDAVIAQSDSDRNLYAVRDALYHRYNGDAEQRVIYTESHDEVANGHARVPEEIWPGNAGSWFSRKRYKYPGINALYRDLIRLRRNWFNQTRGLRGQQINVHHVNNTDKVIAFHRWENGGPGDDVVIVANFGNRSYDSYALGFPRAGVWRVRFNSDWQGYSSDFGNQLGYDTLAGDQSRDGMPFEANVGLGPYSVLILSQDSP